MVKMKRMNDKEDDTVWDEAQSERYLADIKAKHT